MSAPLDPSRPKPFFESCLIPAERPGQVGLARVAALQPVGGEVVREEILQVREAHCLRPQGKIPHGSDDN